MSQRPGEALVTAALHSASALTNMYYNELKHLATAWTALAHGVPMRQRRILAFLFFVFFGSPAYSQIPAPDTFAGIVVTDTGVPVAGATVIGKPIPLACRPLSQIFSACGFWVQTDSAGRFRTSTPGSYYICAQPAQPNQVDSCAWGGYGPAGSLLVSSGTAESTNLRLILRTGTLVKFEIEDRDQFVARGVYFHLYVRGKSEYASVVLISQGNPVVFGVGIPPGETFQFYTGTPLIVYDEAGRSVSQLPPYREISVGLAETVVRLKAIPQIVNAASYWPGLPIRGIASLFGSGLTNVRGIVTADRFPLPTELAGTSVYVEGIPAPIFAVANIGGQDQINFQVPADNGLGRVVVHNNGVQKEFPSLLSTIPGIFVNNAQPAIQHGSDYSPASPANPARRGETIVIYATGLGSTNPAVPIGSPAPVGTLSTCTSQPLRPPVVRIGSTNATILFCGLAPGFVGLYQVNVEVPADTPSGQADLVIIETASGETSNTVKLPVE